MIDKMIENYKGVLKFTEKIRRNTMEIANYQTTWGEGCRNLPLHRTDRLKQQAFLCYPQVFDRSDTGQ